MPSLITVAAAAAAAASTSTFTSNSQDRCELASLKEEALSLPSGAPCMEIAPCPPTEEANADLCREPTRIVLNDLQVTASTNLINELNGVSERVTVNDSGVKLDPPEAGPLPVELESPEDSVAEVESAPSSTSLALSAALSLSPPPTPPPASPVPPLAVVATAAITTTSPFLLPPLSSSPLPLPSVLPAVQGDLEGEEVARIALSEDLQETLEREEVEADGQPEENAESQALNSRKDPGSGKCAPFWSCLCLPGPWKSEPEQLLGWCCQPYGECWEVTSRTAAWKGRPNRVSPNGQT